MIREKLKVINLFLILIKLIGSKFYALRKVILTFQWINTYVSNIDSLLEICAPFKKLNKKKLTFLTNRWITQGLENSIKKKNNIYSKFAKCKNQKLKEFYHNNYKTYRNFLLILLKMAKEKYSPSFLMKH